MLRPILIMQLTMLLILSAYPAAAQESNSSAPASSSLKTETAPVIPADYREEGTASWYGREFQGNVTASGTPYDKEKLTAAHNYLPLGVTVRVTNMGNNKTTAVLINDRGPFVPDRIIDLSEAAARELGFIESGKAAVLIEPYRAEINKEETAAPARPQKKNLYGAFYIQVGAYKVKTNADRLIERLHKIGFTNTRTVRVVTDSAQIFKVQVGMYKTLDNVRKAHLKLGPGFPGTFVLADVIQD